MKRFDSKIYTHIFFLFILSLSYLIPLLIFGKLTTAYHDNLDSGVVYNHIIGKIFNGELLNANIFLGGEIKTYYLRHFFKPFVAIYSLFESETAFFLNEVIVKLIAYISSFVLFKKFNKNYFFLCLCSSIYASSFSFSTLGYGLSFFPYVVYLSLFKNKLTLKHYFLLIFFGLNTDAVADIFFIPITLIIIYILKENIKINILKTLKILIIFFSFSILTSSNILFVQLFGETMHRTEFINFENNNNFFFGWSYSIENIFKHIVAFLSIPTNLDFTFFTKLPVSILLVPSLLIAILEKKNSIVKKITISLIVIYLFLFIEKFYMNTSFFSSIGALRLSWIEMYLPFFYVLLFFILLINVSLSKIKLLIFFGLISLFTFQVKHSSVPLIKKFYLKEENYRNIYTFDGYYLYEDYKKISQIVKNKRVVSLGYDPLVAVMNGISTIDGYHALYPLSYKKKFKKMIQNELKENEVLKKYYENWGSRVYAFIDDPKNIKIDFIEAKKLGAEYVISKYIVNSQEVSLISDQFVNRIILYKIN